MQGHGVVALSTGDQPKDIERFRRQTGARYPIHLDDGSAARAFGVKSSPTCILVERGGRILYRGEQPPEGLR